MMIALFNLVGWFVWGGLLGWPCWIVWFGWLGGFISGRGVAVWVVRVSCFGWQVYSSFGMVIFFFFWMVRWLVCWSVGVVSFGGIVFFVVLG